jgi:hypothetical protein
MKKPDEEKLDIIIKQAMKESGMPEENIEQITSYMITYINTGSKYGHTPEGFFQWYSEKGRS